MSWVTLQFSRITLITLKEDEHEEGRLGPEERVRIFPVVLDFVSHEKRRLQFFLHPRSSSSPPTARAEDTNKSGMGGG